MNKINTTLSCFHFDVQLSYLIAELTTSYLRSHANTFYLYRVSSNSFRLMLSSFEVLQVDSQLASAFKSSMLLDGTLSSSPTYCTIITILLKTVSVCKGIVSHHKDSIALVANGVYSQRRGWGQSHDILFQKVEDSEQSNI